MRPPPGFKYWIGPPKPKRQSKRSGGGNRPKRGPDGKFAGSTGGGGQHGGSRKRQVARTANRAYGRATRRAPTYSLWGPSKGRRRRSGGRRRRGWF